MVAASHPYRHRGRRHGRRNHWQQYSEHCSWRGRWHFRRWLGRKGCQCRNACRPARGLHRRPDLVEIAHQRFLQAGTSQRIGGSEPTTFSKVTEENGYRISVMCMSNKINLKYYEAAPEFDTCLARGRPLGEANSGSAPGICSTVGALVGAIHCSGRDQSLATGDGSLLGRRISVAASSV